MCAANSSANLTASSPAGSPNTLDNARKSAEQHAAVAEALEKGLSIYEALLAGGYSVNTARKGASRLPKAVLDEIAQDSKHLIHMGRTLSAEDQENLARGRLRFNTTVGRDDGYNSAKLLGQDRRVNMFVSDVQTGVIVIQPPDKLPAIPSAAELPPAPVNRPKRLKP